LAQLFEGPIMTHARARLGHRTQGCGAACDRVFTTMILVDEDGDAI
jgi:hypothetical protein